MAREQLGYGPVARRAGARSGVESAYRGHFVGYEVQLQITPLQDKASIGYHYVEICAEAADLLTATAVRDRLIATLDAAG